MLQGNHFFQIAEMYLGAPEPIEEKRVVDEAEDRDVEVTITSAFRFDYGIDKTKQFHRNSGPILDWNLDL